MITKGKEGKERLLEGINETADVVSTTMGAKGRTVMISDPYGLGFHVTKDGVSVANSVKLKNDLMSLGSEFIKTAALKTDSVAGDGTTGTTVLTRSMCNDIYSQIGLGRETNDIVLELFKNADEVYEFIKSNSLKVDTVEHVKNIAKISSNNNEEIGDLFKEIYEEAGMSVEIEVVESDSHDTTYEIVKGFTMKDTGYSSSQFINNQEKGRIEFEDPIIYLYNGKVVKMSNDIIDIFKNNSDRNSEDFRPLVLIVEDIEEAALREIVMAFGQQLIFNVAIVQSNLIHEDRKNSFIDASIFLDAEYTDDRIGNYGECEKVIIEKNKVTFINGKGDTSKHLNSLKKQKNKNIATERRIFALESNAAVIKVGGKLPAEISEKKDRIDDANLSIKSALEEGYVPGAGSTFLFANREHFGQVMKNALHSCYKQLMTNGEKEPYFYLNDIYKKGFGYGFNLITNEVSDLYEDGICDSAKVLRVSIENAVHTAATFANINSIIH